MYMTWPSVLSAMPRAATDTVWPMRTNASVHGVPKWTQASSDEPRNPGECLWAPQFSEGKGQRFESPRARQLNQ
jgi:hypothetical protein